MRFLNILTIAGIALLMSCEKAVSEPVEEGDNYVLTQAKSAKRGVAFSFAKHPDSDIPLLGPSVSWSYDWSSKAPATMTDSLFAAYGMDFCPMAWNNGYDAAAIRAYKAAHPEAKYILGFNEPNLTDQCNMTPAQAAKYWPGLVALARELDMKLIAPAMNYGTLAGYSSPWTWLDEFFTYEGCGLETVDGIALHCYMAVPSALEWFVGEFKKYGKPIWLTEFCDWEGDKITADTQRSYMCEVLNYLETDPDVFRYAWFIPRGDYDYKTHYNLLSASAPYTLTDLGKVFANFSTFDQSIVYKPGKTIPAEQYAACEGQFHLQPSTDGGVLDLCDFKAGCSTSYNIDVKTAGTYRIKVRCLSEKANPQLSVRCGEQVASFSLMPGSWNTAETELQLPSGSSVLVLEGVGTTPVYINWLRFISITYTVQ